MSKVKTISFNPPSFLSKSKLERLNRLLETTRSVQSFQLASAVGLRGADAFRLVHALAQQLDKKMVLAIYHFCEDAEAPLQVDTCPWDGGFPKVPYQCPNCGEEVLSTDDLSYDFALYFPEIIQLEGGR